MPREVLWTVLNLLASSVTSLQYVYHRPEKYNEDWLTRDPGKPRLVPKLGGVARLGIPNKLLVLTGYDADRVKQLIAFFEPVSVLVGLQAGSQFDNQARNVQRCKETLKDEARVEYFEVDAYSEGHGYEAIKEAVKSHLGTANIIMSSLGPKPSAVALYRLHKEHEQTALAYAPSNEVNPDYSRGIGEALCHILHVGE